MTVEVKYVVIREGEEKMSFTSKKDADAYDKMLDMADVLGSWLGTAPVELDDAAREGMALWLAERKDILSAILKSGQLPAAAETDAETESTGTDAVDITTAAKRVKAA
ncbi:hypothetical protein EDF81_0334 [Enterobacter sp. BIGb0383]|uniref:YebG family protein n=1 Tax=unclassified Enterobacter TaxID=2608935 RepID=UPI000F49EC97|nr:MULTISPECIES: YebG family protein [unclassified Enterobacter]ROP61860.1 hypothetical protein EDF81_0334 [Enterobacter sp. BIGb0383]ROS12021.1 hypothetical protein EC848_0334 [Enterobacter sp. BIGb0359]